MKLMKGMFGSEFDSGGDVTRQARETFGLSCGQMRGHDLVHNGGWYNQDGEKLGWGDLSAMDLYCISQRLERGWTDIKRPERNKPEQWFLIISESDSFWAFRDETTEVAAYGWQQKMKPDMDAPGIRYVVSKARFAIRAGCIYYIGQGTGAKLWETDEAGDLYKLRLTALIKPRGWLWVQLNLPPTEFCVEHDEPRSLCLRQHLTVHTNGTK